MARLTEAEVEKIIHVIPVEVEIDRAVRPFQDPNGFKANRIYLLGTTDESSFKGERGWLVPHCLRKVGERLEALGIEVVTVETCIWDLQDVMRKVSRIVLEERSRGNIVYVNMSAGGPFVSVASALSAMVQDARLYYVRCARYSETLEEKLEHGNGVCDKYEVQFLENFRIITPDKRALTVLVELYTRGSMSTSDLLTVLHDRGVEGFEEDHRLLSRGDKISLLMRLNKGVTGKLEKVGYIKKERRGRENVYRITESGKYVACISGLLGSDDSPCDPTTNRRPTQP
ncbi:MAG: DUF6293 family protein [Candidatus Bathyarchaeota archaeon]|nr:DUF6293 family protein [Candidatus Bathyarchaeota archaeon]